MSRIHVRTMTQADVAFGMQLKTASGWNQLEADWRRVLDFAPHGCFIGSLDGELVGTVASTRFGDIAWISMMLVSEAARGQGVGCALMVAALDYLEAIGVATVRLDATPMGRPLYEKLGFELDYEAARYVGFPSAVVGSDSNVEVRPVTRTDLPLAANLDFLATGTNRAAVLARLFDDEAEYGWCVEHEHQLLGYQMKRCGAHAMHLGPCVANDSAGVALMNAAFRRHATEKVIVDLPLLNELAVHTVSAAGLTVQRPLYRMTRGPRVTEFPTQLWASFGPEKG